MLVNPLLDESSILFEVFHDEFVSGLNVETFISWHLFREDAVLIERYGRIVRSNDLLLHTQFVILFTKSRGAVDNARSVGVCDEGSSLHTEATVFLAVSEKVKERNVLRARKVCALHLFKHLVLLLSEEVFQSALGKDEDFIAFCVPDLYVSEFGVHS